MTRAGGPDPRAVEIPEEVLVACLRAVDPLNGLINWQPSVSYDGMTRDHIRDISSILGPHLAAASEARAAAAEARAEVALSVEELAEALYETESETVGKRLSWKETIALVGSRSAASLFAPTIIAPYRARATAIHALLIAARVLQPEPKP